MVKKKVMLKMLAGSMLLTGSIMADPVSMTSTQLNTYNRSWQEIVGASWEDASGNNVIEVGEEVTFTITMDKQFRGDHDYDALKLWVGDEVIGAPATANGDLLKSSGYEFLWDATGGGGWSDPYNGPTKNFSFKKTFDAVGDYFMTAAVMCSRDLSGLYAKPGTPWWAVKDDKPTTYDFSLWEKNTWRDQGETEQFAFSVVTDDVPEPTSLSLMLLGLTSLGGALFLRRKK